ncbi:hypothetical protein [Nonomuraea rubra]|uniref:hypothetical protein n=1 Tax=Nonomuraea rubra TaxID=46180 RepID=UPI0031F00CE4
MLLIVLGVARARWRRATRPTAPAARPSSGTAEPLKELPGVPASKVAGPMRAARPTARLHPLHRRGRPADGAGPGRHGCHPETRRSTRRTWPAGTATAPSPASVGAAVITGHLGHADGPRRLRPAQGGQARRPGAGAARRPLGGVFVVDKVEHTPKGAFPAKKVYAKLRYPGCGW